MWAGLTFALHAFKRRSCSQHGSWKNLTGHCRNSALALFSRRAQDLYQRGALPLRFHAQQVAVADIPSSLEHVVAAFAVIDPKNGNVEAPVGGPKLTSSTTPCKASANPVPVSSSLR